MDASGRPNELNDVLLKLHEDYVGATKYGWAPHKPHVYENIDAYYNPSMSDDERKLLDKVRKTAITKAYAWLPEHYKFFARWVPETADETGTITV